MHNNSRKSRVEEAITKSLIETVARSVRAVMIDATRELIEKTINNKMRRTLLKSLKS